MADTPNTPIEQNEIPFVELEENTISFLANVFVDLTKAQEIILNNESENPDPHFLPQFTQPEAGEAMVNGLQQTRQDYIAKIDAARDAKREEGSLITPDLAPEDFEIIKQELVQEGIQAIHDAIQTTINALGSESHRLKP